jgi:hypothetical protein
MNLNTNGNKPPKAILYDILAASNEFLDDPTNPETEEKLDRIINTVIRKQANGAFRGPTAYSLESDLEKPATQPRR